MTAGAATIRAATADDAPAVAAMLDASGEPVDWPGLPGWPYLDHLIARARVPIAVIDGRVVGMAGSLEVTGPDVRFLSDLFVLPDRQDHGIGRALLTTAFEGAAERLTFSSADPRALGSYIRAGLRPWWPVLYLSVPRAALADGRWDPGIEAVPADPVVTGRWSATWTAMDRTVDFAHYASLPDGAGHAIAVDGDVAAVAWSNRTRRDAWRAVDHVSIAPGADAERVTVAALRAALGDAPGVVVTIPGPHPAVPWLLERGARITDRDEYCATDPALLDPERILPSPGFL
jgi:GNAT superfamily N-acetyltransferase